MVPMVTTWLCHYSGKAAIDCMSRNGCGCVPTKLYLLNSGGSLVHSISSFYSFLILMLDKGKQRVVKVRRLNWVFGDLGFVSRSAPDCVKLISWSLNWFIKWLIFSALINSKTEDSIGGDAIKAEKNLCKHKRIVFPGSSFVQQVLFSHPLWLSTLGVWRWIGQILPSSEGCVHYLGGYLCFYCYMMKMEHAV